MSGLELLLQAAFVDAPSSPRTPASRPPSPQSLPRSNSNRSLPPKKRTKLGRRSSGLSVEQWQNILQTVMSTTSGKANASSGKTDINAGRSKTNASKSSRRRRRAAPRVKDVDGNDIGMGYFSANPSRNTVSPVSVPTSPVAVPCPVAIQNKGDDAAAAAERRLCREYLAALHRPAAYW